jgi:hypothetical protein
MRPKILVCAAALLAASLLVFGASALAGDPPAEGMPNPAKKIVNPLLLSAVGTWSVTWTADGPSGPQSGTATSRIAMAVGDTAVVEDYASTDMMPGGFYGHGVLRPSEDGKTLNLWWFDSMGGEPMKMTGPLTDTSSTVEGPSPMGPMKITWKKVEGGFDFDGEADGKPWLVQKYRAAK